MGLLLGSSRCSDGQLPITNPNLRLEDQNTSMFHAFGHNYGLVKLADFGVATKLTEADVNTHSVVGTPYWMAPEDFRTEHKAFLLSIINGGQTLIVVERNRSEAFDFTMELGSWMVMGFLRGNCVREGHGEFKKDWRKAVVVYRQDLDIHWSVINLGLSRELRRRVEVVELHADIVVLWFLNEVEKKLVLRYEFGKLCNTRLVKVVEWSQS
ncbi:Tyrosine-protein kinase [Parasponia andersonii]|uniref:Tyrosine-protein kinase n=1 Tax=Parasponia andersonii TaxID=3476 RepID=A0A2P5AYT9_PARAD|nr:Tyrosine-protein kinase [Parasponia andersonii]